MTGSDPTDDVDWGDDPRLSGEHVRRVSDGDGGTVSLVGVVHDHPASAHRVRAVIGRLDPAVVALELPSVALPLFETPAADDGLPGFGDEMRAAVDAAGDGTVVGIDMPSRRYLRALAGTLRAERSTLREALDAVSETLDVASHAVWCRLAAATGGRVGGDRVRAPLDHGVGVGDAPTVQAEDEAAHIARSRSLLGAVQTPAAIRLTDSAREKAMGRALAAARREGDVVAVVGADHLDPVASHLERA